MHPLPRATGTDSTSIRQKRFGNSMEGDMSAMLPCVGHTLDGLPSSEWMKEAISSLCKTAKNSEPLNFLADPGCVDSTHLRRPKRNAVKRRPCVPHESWLEFGLPRTCNHRLRCQQRWLGCRQLGAIWAAALQGVVLFPFKMYCIWT